MTNESEFKDLITCISNDLLIHMSNIMQEKVPKGSKYDNEFLNIVLSVLNTFLFNALIGIQETCYEDYGEHVRRDVLLDRIYQTLKFRMNNH